MFHFRQTHRNRDARPVDPLLDAELQSMQHAMDVERLVTLRPAHAEANALRAGRTGAGAAQSNGH